MKIKNFSILVGAVHLSYLILLSSSVGAAVIQLDGDFYILQDGGAVAPPPPPAEIVTVMSAGQVWMDRNLGASRVATSMTDKAAYGDLYQWGRGSDGHEKRNSGTRSTLSISDNPGHTDFIAVSGYPYDWRSPQNDYLWQGVSGINNPCPPGFRLPTKVEWETELQSWSSYDTAGAYHSPLKLVPAGCRFDDDTTDNGTIYHAGSVGIYWSKSVNDGYSHALDFYEIAAHMLSYGRAYGHSIRCLKD